LAVAIAALLWSGLVAAADDDRGDRPDDRNAHRVTIGRVSAEAKSCAKSAYGDGPATAVLAATLDADTPQTVTSTGLEDVCLRNSGTSKGRLLVSAQQVVDLEVGACTAAESSLGGDTTCANGALGELSSAITLVLGPLRPGSAGGCRTMGVATPTALQSAPQVLALELKPGDVCRYGPAGARFVDGLSEAGKHVSQTDRVQLDLIFTLRD